MDLSPVTACSSPFLVKGKGTESDPELALAHIGTLTVFCLSLAVEAGQRVNPGAYPGGVDLSKYGMPQQKPIFPSTSGLREPPSSPGAVGNGPRGSEYVPVPGPAPLSCVPPPAQHMDGGRLYL